MSNSIGILIIIFFLSCGQPAEQADSETVKEGNKSITISTDTAKLAKLVDLSTFKPTKVQFKYTFIDNSGKGERITVPGPSDSYLEALLYFDSVTFQQLRSRYFNMDYAIPDYKKSSFDFDWLEPEIKQELSNSDSNYHGHPDAFFGLGQSGKLWLLSNKLLLTKSSN